MSENINLEDIRKLSEEVNSLVQSGVIPLNDSTKKVVDKFTDLADAVSKVKMDDLGKSAVKVKNALDNVTDATKDLIEKEEELADEFGKLTGGALKKFGKEMLSAAGDFLSAVNDVSSGYGKYAKSVEHVGKAAKDLASNFGTYGEMAGWSAEKMAEWTAESLRQNDVLNKTFETLSKFGQVDDSDLRRMMDTFHYAGLSVKDTEAYIQAVTKASSSLATFGSSAAEGRRVYDEQLRGILLNEEERKRFSRMGYNAQDMVETSANIMSNLALSQRGQKADTVALHKATTEYLETQAELTALTGQSRDEAMQARKAQEEDVAFQIHLAQLSKTPEGAIQAENQRIAAQQARASMGAQGQTALQQMFRNRGDMSMEASSRLGMVGGQGAMQQMYQATMNATGTAHERTARIIDAQQRLSKNILKYGEFNAGTLGYAKGGQLAEFMMTPDTYKGVVSSSTKSGKDLDAVAAAMARIPEDDRRGRKTELELDELRLKEVTDKATYAMGEVATKSINKMAGAAEAAADSLAKIGDLTGMTNNWQSGKQSNTSPGGSRSSGSYSSSGAGAKPSGQNVSSAELGDLKDLMKPGAHTNDKVDSKLVDIMRKVSKEIPGFNRFTSVNDRNDPNSKHSKGQAFDMTLNDPTPENIDAAIKILRSHGLYVFDEYRHKSSNWSGPHLHAGLQGRTGGIFSGPKSGYQVELHGKEAVIPMSNYKSLLADKTKGDDSVTKHQLTNPGSAVSTSSNNSDSGMLKQLMNMLIGRFDDMIYELQTANSATATIAKNSKKK